MDLYSVATLHKCWPEGGHSIEIPLYSQEPISFNSLVPLGTHSYHPLPFLLPEASFSSLLLTASSLLSTINSALLYFLESPLDGLRVLALALALVLDGLFFVFDLREISQGLSLVR